MPAFTPLKELVGDQRSDKTQRKALATFEAEVGGRAALIDHLNHSSLTVEQDYLLGLIADPRNSQRSLATIAKQAGIPFGKVIQFFQDAGFAKAHLEAFKVIWAKLPDVTADVMKKALPQEVKCKLCGGSGRRTIRKKIYEDSSNTKFHFENREMECGSCEGKGLITLEPLHEVQKTALELGRLLTKGGVNVQVNATQVNQTAILSSETMTAFREASDRVLFPSRRAAAAAPASTSPSSSDASTPEDSDVVDAEEMPEAEETASPASADSADASYETADGELVSPPEGE